MVQQNVDVPKVEEARAEHPRWGWRTSATSEERDMMEAQGDKRFSRAARDAGSATTDATRLWNHWEGDDEFVKANEVAAQEAAETQHLVLPEGTRIVQATPTIVVEPVASGAERQAQMRALAQGEADAGRGQTVSDEAHRRNAERDQQRQVEKDAEAGQREAEKRQRETEKQAAAEQREAEKRQRENQTKK